MTMPDPLEHLRRSLAQIRKFGLEEQFFFHRLQNLPDDLARETLGQVGALFAHFDDLRRINEEMLKQDLDQAEVALRRDIDRSLDKLLRGLGQFRDSLGRL